MRSRLQWGRRTSWGKRSVPEPTAIDACDAFQFQLATTAITLRWLALNRLRLVHGACQPVRPASVNPRQPTSICQLEFAIRAHEAVVADLVKFIRQNVLGEGANE